MSLFREIFSIFEQKPIPSLQKLAVGLCALPPVPVRVASKPKDKQKDMYVIDEVRQEFGFHTATAIIQAEGSSPLLTDFDIQILKDRGYFGKTKQVLIQNERAKEAWHKGATEREAAALVGVGESWIEKRYGTFSTALSVERGQMSEL